MSYAHSDHWLLANRGHVEVERSTRFKVPACAKKEYPNSDENSKFGHMSDLFRTEIMKFRTDRNPQNRFFWADNSGSDITTVPLWVHILWIVPYVAWGVVCTRVMVRTLSLGPQCYRNRFLGAFFEFLIVFLVQPDFFLRL